MSVFLNQYDPGLKFPLKIPHEQAMLIQSARRDRSGAASRNSIARWSFANSTAGRGFAILCISIAFCKWRHALSCFYRDKYKWLISNEAVSNVNSVVSMVIDTPNVNTSHVDAINQ